MDSARTKTVEVEGVRYVIRRMTPADGSYLWHRLLHATMLLQQEQQVDQTEEPSSAPTEEAPPPEDRIRALCGLAFMKLTWEETREVQERSMKVLMRVSPETQLPLPVMADSGQWACPEMEDSPALVTRMTVEVLVYNLAGFIGAGSQSKSPATASN